MSHLSSARQLAEALVHAGSYGKTTSGPVASSAFTLAVSRQPGAGGTAIATAVADRLGWPVYDNNLLERIAQEMNLRSRLLESVDERRMSWVLECIESFSQVPAVSESAFVRHLIGTVLSLGAHGSCVIVGRGAPHILPLSSTLRLRFVAPRDDRVARFARDHGIGRAEAARQVDTIDRERVRFIQDHFQKDTRDPENFDLVLNTSRLTPAECADTVIDALHRLQARAAGR